MKKELIYEFSIEAPLTPAKRKIVEKHVGKLGEASEKPLSYEWVDDGQPVLRISVEPILLEIKFAPGEVKVFGTAPLWARVMFTKKRRQELQGQIENILRLAKFTTAESAPPRKATGTSRSKIPVKKKANAAQRELA